MSALKVYCKGQSHTNNITTSDLVFTEGYNSVYEGILSSVGILRVGTKNNPSTWVDLDRAVQKLRDYLGEYKEAASQLISDLGNMQGPTPSVPTQISIYIEEEKHYGTTKPNQSRR